MSYIEPIYNWEDLEFSAQAPLTVRQHAVGLARHACDYAAWLIDRAEAHLDTLDVPEPDEGIHALTVLPCECDEHPCECGEIHFANDDEFFAYLAEHGLTLEPTEGGWS